VWSALQGGPTGHPSRLWRGQTGFGVAGSHALSLEVDVAPSQADELAPSESGEGCGDVDRRVLLGRGRSQERVDLLWCEHVDLDPHALCRLLDSHDGIARELPNALSALHHSVQDSEYLEARSVGHGVASGERDGEALDVLDADV
jgi:hypothetical protein